MINDTGRLLQQAWEWKINGEKDFVILAKLDAMGLKMSKQKLSAMWRNPFYCGICAHAMLKGEVVKGNWEKMVSEEDFLLVQEILSGNRQGYKLDKANPLRPLNGFISCSICGAKLSGYEVKKKKLHYYKCPKCKGVSINANTTKRAIQKGAHDIFFSLLASYELRELLVEPFKEQLAQTFSKMNEGNAAEEKVLKEQLVKAQEELKKLTRNFAIVGFEKNIYDDLKSEIEGKIRELTDSIQKCSVNLSNLNKYINVSIEAVRNISNSWASGDLEIKRKIQELIFPEGLSLDVKNRQYLTKKVNSLFLLIQRISGEKEEKERGLLQILPEQSSVVAGLGLEPRTFGL